MAAGAEGVAREAKVIAEIDGAVGDLNYVVATTARGRDMTIPTMLPHEAAAELRRRPASRRRRRPD